MDWDKYFMSLVAVVSSKSKDKKTHHGSIIVGKNNEIRSTGYNSFVRGLNDNIPERQERPEKYYWFEHSERNAIYNAALHGVSLDGCRIYISGIPCTDCARGIIQSGITKVISFVRDFKTDSETWDSHTKRTIQMFKETSVELEFYNREIIDGISFFLNDKEVK